MRLTAALTSLLLVAVMGVAAVQDIRSHRKVLQDTAPAAANETMTTTGAEPMNVTTTAENAGNATANTTDERSRFAGSTDAPLVRCTIIDCKKRKLLQTLAADTVAAAINETKAAGAEVTNASEGVVNATLAAAGNATASGNATGNGTDSRSRRGGRGDGWGGGRGGSPYSDRTAWGV